MRWDIDAAGCPVRMVELRTVPPTTPALEVGYVREKVLRVVNGTIEDEFINRIIFGAAEAYENHTFKALMPQTWKFVLDRFPAGRILLPRPPFIEVESFSYIDSDGAEQTLSASPEEFYVRPSGVYTRAELWPVSGTSWPSVLTESAEPVAITYRAGHTDGPALEHVRMGLQVMIAEAYKLRTASVLGTYNAAVFQPERFWRRLF